MSDDSPSASAFTPEAQSQSSSTLLRDLRLALRPLASLKLTVGLFVCSMVLIMAGTLAQVDSDIWDVVRDYFRCWFAHIPIKVFHHLFQPFLNLSGISQTFVFPGGYLIGTLMAANLFAAHLSKFVLQAKGLRLGAGLLILLLGCGVTWLVIDSGNEREGLEGTSKEMWDNVWLGLQVATVALGAINIAALVVSVKERSFQAVPLILSLSVVGGAAWWLFFAADKRFDDSSMRILWQLTQAEIASVILLVGCGFLFRRRAGVVLLHAGIGLLMVNEVVVDSLHVETQMMIEEGQSRSWADDIREVELAFVDSSDPKFDEEILIRKPLLEKVRDGKDDAARTIQDQRLPFDVEIVEYFQNSRLMDVAPGEKTRATVGTGLKLTVERASESTGTDSGGAVDQTAAFVKLINRETKQEIGTLLTGIALQMTDDPELPPNRVTVNGKSWDIALRFRRYYKRFQVEAKEIRKEDYIGTMTPRDYRTVVRLVDPVAKEDFEQHIWMNNPMRHAGDTFYQSGYFEDPRTGKKTTTLSVVTNTGWMIPYMSCMIVGTGMLAHFWLMLVRFTQRRVTETRVIDTSFGFGGLLFEMMRSLVPQPAPPVNVEATTKGKSPIKVEAKPPKEPTPFWQLCLSCGLAAVVVLWVLSKAREPQPRDGAFDFKSFGRIPVVYEGRVQPIDTLARNSLLILSNRSAFKDEDGNTQPAVRWLLDVLTNPEVAAKHRVYRIDHPQLLEKMDLERRKTHLYSGDEIKDGIPKIVSDVTTARKKDAKHRTADERKLLELARKLELVMLLTESFQPPDIDVENIQQSLPRVMRQLQMLDQQTPPLIIPPSTATAQDDINASDTWQTYARGWTRSYLAVNALGQEAGKDVHALTKILVAYLHGTSDEKESDREKQIADFNDQVVEYLQLVGRSDAKDYDAEKVGFEAWYNYFAPFYYTAFGYLLAFVFALAGLADPSRTMNRAALFTICGLMLVHGFSLWARIYISGRPPVTNLYSSAVFIGFGCVLLGAIFEFIYPLGIGNIVASALGAGTLGVAYLLSGDGDTFKVLQAVLDTQFWLATHVVCITLGYSTTLLSGVLGLFFVLMGLLSSKLDSDMRRVVYRLTYGTACFGILFSFIGTVLGGLWADDSWGRFWGWDPKENGALLIVLWNAVILHARWDRMVNERGFAVLAVIGNIVTTWSWFGVNELGAGLHAYGFREGSWMALWSFWMSQMVIVACGLIPTAYWWSYRGDKSGADGTSVLT